MARLRPTTSPSLPLSSIRPPKATVYAVTAHCLPESDRPTASWIDGATDTIVESSVIISCAIEITASTTPRPRHSSRTRNW
jgi:hypothetical protein